MGFVRILMALSILAVLALDGGLFLLTLGHDLEECTTALVREQGYSQEKAREGCEFPEMLVNYRYFLYGISAVLIILFGHIFKKVD